MGHQVVFVETLTGRHENTVFNTCKGRIASVIVDFALLDYCPVIAQKAFACVVKIS